MTTAPSRRLRTLLAGFGALALLALAGCATPQAASSSEEQPFEQAVAQATDALVAQRPKLPGPLARLGPRRGVVVDPMIDAGGGQQTVATQLLQNRVVERIGERYHKIEMLPFDSASLAKARYLLTGTLTRQPRSAGQAGDRQQVDLALTELRSGKVVAQSSAVARDEGLDGTPLPYYQASPVPTRDRVSEGYVRTSATRPGQNADRYYLEQLAAAPAIHEAMALVNAQRYEEALTQYAAAARRPAGEQLRVLSGIYLATARLGRDAEAEQAFGKVVAYGIANNELGIKFLFKPNTTAFWADPKISGPYAMWLRQIAKAGGAADSCIDIIGHTSHTGTEAYNDALSLRRASFIRQRLISESAALAERTRPGGRGFRDNLIGSGTDNAVDALDRRVEFKIVSCSRA